jgi:hypothetical protein
MKRETIIQIVNSSLLVGSAFILCAALGMLINPDAFHKLFSPVQLFPDPMTPSRSRSYYWDVRSYAEMALSNRCVAFYPLWPLLIRILFHPQTVEQAAADFLGVSTVIFLISIPLLFWIFSKAFTHHNIAFLLLLAFSVNPMSIFRVIGYTESLFSALTAIFMWLLLSKKKLNEKVLITGIFGVTFLMSLLRPILLSFWFSSFVALGTIFYFESLKQETQSWKSFLAQIKQYSQEIKVTITLCLSTLLGYAIYGFFCWKSRGDFFAPFKDQERWGTKLGFHLELLLFPKSPLFDLLGLYFPLLILVVALILVYCKVSNQQPLVWVPRSPLENALFLYPPLLVFSSLFNYLKFKNQSAKGVNYLTRLVTSEYPQNLRNNFLFWFCVYFPFFHSILIFFTRDRLYSLGRYIFGTPFFFMALGYLCCCIPGKKTPQALRWFIVICAIALVEQWVNYGENKWLG